jgi:hypothetical protein
MSKKLDVGKDCLRRDAESSGRDGCATPIGSRMRGVAVSALVRRRLKLVQ